MKVHARLSPGLVRPGEELSIRIHIPRKLSGVTLKLWETENFVGRDGESKRDPGGDVLLAQWDGDLVAGDGRTPNDADYVKFTKKSESLTTPDSDDEDAFRIWVKLPGSDSVIHVPLGSEKTELSARSVSLALSVEQGGSELFRTKSSCTAVMPMTPLAFDHHRFSLRDESAEFQSEVEDDKIEEAHAHQWVTFGIKNGDGMNARLEVVGSGYLDARGVALDSDDAKAQPVVVRKGRKLYAYIHERKLDLPKGVSKIPIAACEEIDAAGSVVAERPEQGDMLELRLAEVPVKFGDRATFGVDLSKVGAEGTANDDHVTAWSEAAKRFRREG